MAEGLHSCSKPNLAEMEARAEAKALYSTATMDRIKAVLPESGWDSLISSFKPQSLATNQGVH